MSAAKPRNCRHCTHMTCGDANWCDAHEVTLSDVRIGVRRECEYWEWCPIDALTMEDPDHDRAVAQKREMALYERRMRGDWS